MNSACRSATDSGLPDAVLAVVAGGWGDWSSFTGRYFPLTFIQDISIYVYVREIYMYLIFCFSQCYSLYL